MKKYPYKLRCYIKPEGDYLVASCIDLDLAIKADDMDSTKKQLADAIQSYLNSLDKNNFTDLFPRLSPLSVRLEYHAICTILNCIKTVANARDKWAIFCESFYPQGGFQVTSCV